MTDAHDIFSTIEKAKAGDLDKQSVIAEIDEYIDKVHSVIKIPDVELRDIINKHFESSSDSYDLVEYFGKKASIERRLAWAIIKEHFPETEDMICSYNTKRGEITIDREQSKADKEEFEKEMEKIRKGQIIETLYNRRDSLMELLEKEKSDD